MKRPIIIFMWASAIAVIVASHLGWFQGEAREIGLYELKKVIPKASSFSHAIQYPPHYRLYKANELIGIAYLTTDIVPEEKGYAGPIEILVGLDLERKIAGIKILRHTETPAYASGIEEPWFQDQFKGMDATHKFEIGEDIDGISGATQSVSSIGHAIKRSLQIIESKVLTDRKRLDLELGAFGELKRLNVWFLLVLSFAALFSYLARVRWLRTLILACSLIYLGILSSTFFSIYHITSLLEWELPPFRYNVLWWELIMVVFILSLGFGRIWCGYLCPFGALQEFLYRIIPLKAKLRRLTSNGVDEKLKLIKYVLLWIIIVLFFSTGKVNLANYEPYTTLFSMRGSIFGWALVAFSLGSSIFVNRFWCRYFCLAGAGLAIVSRASLGRLKLTGDCGGCDRCVKSCGMGAFERSKGIDHSECIMCNRCRDLCKDKFVKILSVWRRERR